MNIDLSPRKMEQWLALPSAQPISAVWWGLLGLWIASLILTPISLWIAGDATIPYTMSVGVVVKVSLVLFTLSFAWSASRILGTVAVVAILTWLAEYIGSHTGYPFGDYSYTDQLQPQIGHVPLIIPLAWMMMLPSAWAVVQVILRGSRWENHPLVVAVLSGLAFTAWDLYLDPQMVSKDLWVWHAGGGYFGIPWLNFAGWWLVSSLVTLAVRPHDLPHRPLLLIYGLVWWFQAVGLGILWGQSGPAVVGCLAMGFWLAWASYRELKTWSYSS